MAYQKAHKRRTEAEIRELYKGQRITEIVLGKDGFVDSVSLRQPCMFCGKYHRFDSKAHQRCNTKIVCGVHSIMNSDRVK